MERDRHVRQMPRGGNDSAPQSSHRSTSEAALGGRIPERLGLLGDRRRDPDGRTRLEKVHAHSLRSRPMADRITLGAAALPEPEPAWLAAVEDAARRSSRCGRAAASSRRRAPARRSPGWPLLTAWTARVRVGSAVLVLPLYHPVVVAKQLADLDARSGGRVSVAVGVGGEFPAEFDAVGVPLAERGPRTDEAMDVLRSLWAGGPARRTTAGTGRSTT